MFNAAMLLALLVPSQGEVRPRFPVGPDTTYVTGPLRKDGTIDYQAALNSRLGDGVAPDQNANVLLWRALGPHPERATMPPGYFPRLGVAPPPEKGDYLQSITDFVGRGAGVPAEEYEILFDEQKWAGRRPWASKDFPRVAGWLKANEKPLRLVVAATRRPKFFNPLYDPGRNGQPPALFNVLLPQVQKTRLMAAMLECRAMLRLGQRKPDAAWADLMACHRLGRLMSRGGSLIEALVGYAIEAVACRAEAVYLGSGPHPAARLRRCVRDLQSLPRRGTAAEKMDLTERFSFLDTVQLARSGEWGMVRQLVPRLGGKRAAKGATAADWDACLRTGNRFFDRYADACRLDRRAERDRALDRADADLKKLKAGRRPAAFARTMVAGLMPTIRKVSVAHDRARQYSRNNVVAFALRAYRVERGRYPANLAALVPGYLPRVPGDVAADGPLKYRPAAGGFLLYAVGDNRKDDGGRGYDDKPPADDLAVRIPLPRPRVND